MLTFNRNTFFLLVLIGFSACDQHKDNDSNQVTVNPAATASQVEKNVLLGMDKSPLDLSYYPVEYPKLKMSHTAAEPLIARVIYSRPQKDGRTIFGNVLKYGEPWRMGANEATELEFFKDVTIQTKKVPKGRYILYCIPYEDKWTLVLNDDLYTWGLKIDSTKDLFKFDVPAERTSYNFEVLTIVFEKAFKGMDLIMAWDNTRASLPINF